ncbi:uncharacterized protein si:ch73-204p21.2 [Engraulis encrasicolus]|uniref:uncharacterized protein si:ch73-204p21.2 n=1 Tax=Engraulis encrasicolus TaxID=184585 RepID=UPI002FD1B362
MAPLVAHLPGLVTEAGPAITVLAFIALLLILINLLNVCTMCQKQSFELQHEGAKVERNSSTLVRVVKLEDAAKENPAIEEIKNDEQDLSSIPEDYVPDGNGEVVTAWRNHTIKSVFPEDGQVANGGLASVTVTSDNAGGDLDGTVPTTTSRHALQASMPMFTPLVEVESSLQSATPPPPPSSPPPTHLALEVTAAPVARSWDFSGSQPEPTTASYARQPSLQEDQEDFPPLPRPPFLRQDTLPEDTSFPPAPPSTSALLVPQQAFRSNHDYEAISDLLRGPTPTPSEAPSDISGPPVDIPSYDFVTQLEEPYATSTPVTLNVTPTLTPGLTELQQQGQEQEHSLVGRTPSMEVEVEEIADLEDRHSTAMYARVSKRIKCPTPPPVPPPDETEELGEEVEEEEEEEIAPPIPDRAQDADQLPTLSSPL